MSARGRSSLAVLLAMSIGCRAAAEAGTAALCDAALAGVPGYGEAKPLPDDAAAMLFTRRGESLRLALDGGEAVLRDRSDCVPSATGAEVLNCVEHRFVAAFAEPRGILVRRNHWEHDDYVWVDRQHGWETSFGHLPRFSPGLRWMLSVSPSEAAHAFNGIELFDITRGVPQRVWQHVPAGKPETFYLFAFLRWTGPESALLCGYRETEVTVGGDARLPPPSLVELRRGPMGWALHLAGAAPDGPR